ncbi:autotransporter domain-containing protein [uncultured Reyranella sp.]|uniref:autotransporter outer membrane beta-barrel domain-containing protein n=1 Tax=uncultured Reyranella sp. TaxID=735512 RepID=UPI0025D17B8C|nr:autotransporter domain-containing protein [uncultured Reyranella sp.]
MLSITKMLKPVGWGIATCVAGWPAGPALAQAGEPTNIPLSFLTQSGGTQRLVINVGINGGAPKPYLFDTGSALFNSVYNADWWPGLAPDPSAHNVASTPGLPQGIQYCYGTSKECRGYTGNIVAVPVLNFYANSDKGTPVAATLAATPGYQINAVYEHTDSSTTYFPGYWSTPAWTQDGTPPIESTLFGTFGAGNFISNKTSKVEPGTSYTTGGVLGQTIVAGGGVVSQGYVVAANGQKNPTSSDNGPQQANGQSVLIGGKPDRVAITGCSPCVTVGLTPQMLGQFMPIGLPASNPTGSGVVPWTDPVGRLFPNPYGGAPQTNASTEFGANFTMTLTKPGDSRPSVVETKPGLLDTGTQDLTLNTRQPDDGLKTYYDNLGAYYVNAGVKLDVTGANGAAIPGLPTTSSILTAPGSESFNTYNASIGTNATNTFGLSFFLANSVLFDLSDRLTGYTPFFVTNQALDTTGGPLIVDGSNVLLGLAGAVSGTGGVTINAGGGVQLSATNTYTGPTTIASNGQLYVTGPGSIALSSGVANDGIFDISRAWAPVAIQTLSGAGHVSLGGQNLRITNGSSLFSGIISDRNDNALFAYPASGGSVTVAGGVQILSGANTYTGGTTVTGGATLGIFHDTNLGTGGRLALDGGTLAAMASFTSSRAMTLGANGGAIDTRGNTLTLTGRVSGAGGLYKQGEGLLVLSGLHDYLGGTTVNEGTLRLGAGASLPSTGALTVNGGVFDLNGNSLTVGALSGAGGTIALGSGTLISDDDAATVLASVITGTGGLTKSGTGSLNLTGVNTYTGPTRVTGGRLAVNGSITSDVTVGTGGTLGGAGTVFGSVTNGGVLAPGNSIGTLTVNGALVVSAGSTYQVEANSLGQADRVNVTGAPGTATLNGGGVSVLAAPGVYAPSTTYTILNATGGVTGTLAGASTNLPFLQASLSYDPGNVFLTLAPGGFARGAATANQAATGAVLDRSVAGATGDFATVIGTLAGVSLQQGQAAMDAISGQNYSGFATAGIGNSLGFMNVLGQQMSLARGGAGSGTRTALAQACDAVACDDAASPWSLWGSVVGVTGSVAGTGGAATLTYNSGGAAAGVDYRVAPNLLLGLGVGFASGNQWLSGFSGRATTDSYQGTLYASFTQSGFYLDALAGIGFSNNNMTRQIPIAGLISRTAFGQTSASQFLGQVEAGYAIGLHEASRARATPFARLQGITNNQAGFGEWGANSLDLTVAQQTTGSLRTTVGVDLEGAFDLGWRDALALQLRLGWAHEFADTARPVTATFAGAPGAAFTVYGAAPQRNAAVIGLAASTAIAPSTSLYLRYDGDVGTGTDNHALSAGLRMRW